MLYYLGPVTRRLAAWLLCVPVMIAGTEAGHWLDFRVVYPDPYVRAQVLAGSGHGYLSHWLTGVAVLAALAVAGFGGRAFGPRPFAASTVSLGPFLALAPLTFALQECVERLATGGWPFSAILEPTFFPGVVLQVPFALLTYIVARALLRTADRIRLRRISEPFSVLLFFDVLSAARTSVDVPRLRELCSGYGLRGPPLAAVRA